MERRKEEKNFKKTVTINKSLYLATMIVSLVLIVLLFWIAFIDKNDNSNLDIDKNISNENKKDDVSEIENIADNIINDFAIDNDENKNNEDLEISVDTSKFNTPTVLPDYTKDISLKWDKKMVYIGNGSDVYDEKCPNEEVFMIPGFDELSLEAEVYCFDDSLFSGSNLSTVLYEVSYLNSAITKTEEDTSLNFQIIHISKFESLGKLGQDEYGIGKFSSNSGDEFGVKYSGSGYLEIKDEDDSRTIYFIPENIYQNLGMKNNTWYMVAATNSEIEINDPELLAYMLSGDIVIMREAK